MDFNIYKQRMSMYQDYRNIYLLVSAIHVFNIWEKVTVKDLRIKVDFRLIHRFGMSWQYNIIA